jgi:diguanylate cyclase (GGDEF)-like protein/PAS domain S-box-containing protein
VPGRLLVNAWREAAEQGGPACVLQPRDGVLVTVWLNQAMSRLLARDAAALAGRPLRDVVDAERDAGPQSPGGQIPAQGGRFHGPSTGDPTDGPEPDPTGGPEPDPTGEMHDDPGDDVRLIGWARLAHQLARDGGGAGLGRLTRVDGSSLRVRVRAVPVHPVAVRPQAPATVPGVGAVEPQPSPEEPESWLVLVDPVGDREAEAEQATAIAEHRFAALAGAAPVGIFASEAGLRLGYVNDHFLALTGRDPHALLGTGWLDAVHPDDLAGVYAAVQTVLAGTAVDLAVRLAGLDGPQRWLQLRLAPTTTPSRAAGFLGIAEDVTQRRSWEEHLTYQARHDPLTGLVNRRRLVEVLTELLVGRRAADRDFAVLFLDLDGFKEVNDTHGHDAGDRALVEVARRLQRTARDSDLLARVAGDEFVLVLRRISGPAEAEAAAGRHLAALAAPIRIGRHEVRLTASVGVALPTGFDTLESLLRAADRVMYQAKAAGPGLYRLAATSGEEPR